ncbi:MAG: T9SS type A sorting domain-containing protein [Bacteroidetes bacterium]|nr:T9SS type A sorting domain-containing protein [Bacteroidota bacterium]
MKTIFFLLILFLFTAKQQIKSQIVYTDVQDTTVSYLNGGGYLLDVNNDAITDYSFAVGGDSTLQYWRIFGMASIGNTYDSINPTAPFGVNVFAHSISASIDSGISWRMYPGMNFMSFEVAQYDTGNAQYYWCGVTDKFMALKFMIGTNTHYGWLRMDVANNASWMKVKDYAFNSQPNQPILAGQTNNGMVGRADDFKDVGFSLFPNPTTGLLNIRATNTQAQNFVVLDMSGRKVLTLSEHTSHLQTIDCSTLERGMYLLKDEESQQAIRFIKE